MMHSIVIDTSVLLAVALDEPPKAKLIKATKGLALLAPSSIKWEIGNALSSMFKRKKISLMEAKKAWDVCMDIPLQYVDIDCLKALDIAFEANIYAYDAYMIACCIERKAPLLTLDKVLSTKAKEFNIRLEEI